mmetsp:Transcript_3775/g.7733  ORF Transcript_3775/g.7733 Transcript_3775/m.7733 type:complete len:89 (+) Transcript_3775:37-303(+)
MVRASLSWMEPGCLERLVECETGMVMPRLLVGTKVKCPTENPRYRGEIGSISFHFLRVNGERDYARVTVRYPDSHEEYPFPDQVVLVP